MSSPSLKGRGAALFALASLVLAGCQRAPVPPPERLVTRLAPLLAETPEWLEGAEKAPSVLLQVGVVRRIPISAARNSRLRFGLSTPKKGPRRGVIELEVRADGERLDVIRVPARSSPAWRSYSLALEHGVKRELEFRTRLIADGGAAKVRRGADRRRPFLALGAPRVVAPVDPAERKVLVWISVDTLRADHLGAYGYPRPTSPAIDQFLRSAARFEDAFSAAPWTLASLAAQFTSRTPSLHGATTPKAKRDRSSSTVFQALGEHGFTVLGVTSNSFVSPKFETAAGFDTLWDTDGAADVVTRLALRALERWDGGHLALFVHYMDPHAYYEPPAAFQQLFAEPYQGAVTTRNFEGLKSVSPAASRFLRNMYDAEIAFTDAQIANLLSGLAGRGLLERAVVVFSADHGEEFQDHGGWGHGKTLYQEMLRVPLGLRVPGLSPQLVEEPVSMLDLAPTLLEALGVPAPASFRGRSLMPLLRGEPRPERALIAELDKPLEGTRLLCVRRGPLKYERIMRLDAPGPALREALHDLRSDPEERRALDTSQMASIRGEAEAYLAGLRTEAAVSAPAQLSSEEHERLRALGYLQ